jgi:alanine dehydrogenase
MPGAVPRSSTYALTNATIDHALRIANLGVEEAVRSSPYLAAGVNTWDGSCVAAGAAAAAGVRTIPLASLI